VSLLVKKLIAVKKKRIAKSDNIACVPFRKESWSKVSPTTYIHTQSTYIFCSHLWLPGSITVRIAVILIRKLLGLDLPSGSAHYFRFIGGVASGGVRRRRRSARAVHGSAVGRHACVLPLTFLLNMSSLITFAILISHFNIRVNPRQGIPLVYQVLSPLEFHLVSLSSASAQQYYFRLTEFSLLLSGRLGERHKTWRQRRESGAHGT